MFVTLLVFLAVLGVMVFVHELGHFLVAKKAGVRVEEFAFGFRPRLWARTIGETTYAINVIPLGGYVKMYGEQEGEIGPGSYRSKGAKARLAILLAGSTMNLLMAWVILTVLFATGFEPFFPNASTNPYINTSPHVVVGQVADASPAQSAGLKIGDELLAVNGTTITASQQFVDLINGFKGSLVTVDLKRDGQLLAVTLTPRITAPAGQGSLGVAIGETGQVKSSLVKAPLAALYETGRIIGASAAGFGNFIRQLVVKQQVSDQVTGLIGVGALTGVARRLGFSYLAQLVALISVGLGVVNLMPILPLDGGHIAVVVYEKIARRKLSERQFSIFATAGLAFILLIFVVVTFKDVMRFNVWGRIF